jgi:hypothetical protein
MSMKMKVAPKEAKKYEAMKAEWIAAVNQLIDQIERWAKSQKWESHREDVTIDERWLGTYTVPKLTVEVPGGEVYAKPIARIVGGGDGRVDLDAFPTLNRVMLIRRDGEWLIITESNVKLRADWKRKVFAELAIELVA